MMRLVAVPLVVSFVAVPLAVVVTVSAIVRRSGAGACLGQRMQMRRLGVLHLGRLDGHTVVDDGNVVGTAVRRRCVVSRSRIVATVAVVTRLRLGDGSEMGGLGVLHFGRVYRHAVVDVRNRDRTVVRSTVVGGGRSAVVVDGRGTVGGGSVGGQMGGAGVLHFGRVDGHTVVDLDGGGGVRPLVATPQGALPQVVVLGACLGVCVRVLDLGGCDFGGVVRHSVCVQRDRAVRPRGGVDERSGVVGVRAGQSVRAVGGRRSDGQVGAGYVETVHGIGGVLDGLDVTGTVDVRVGAVRDAVGGAALVLLRVGVGVAVRVRAVVVLADVLAGDGRRVRMGGGHGGGQHGEGEDLRG